MKKSLKKYFWIVMMVSFAAGINRVGDWESWTSPLIAKDVVELNGKIYSATEGGVLIYDIADESFQTLTNIDGLLGTKLQVVQNGPYGNLWIGGAAPNGFIQVYDPVQFESVHDFDFRLTEIIDIAFSDTAAFALYKNNQDFGIQKFLYQNGRWMHNDLITANWLLESETVRGIVVKNTRVFVGTDHGLFEGSIHTDPIDWIIPHPELEDNISAFCLQNDDLVIVADKMVYRKDLITDTLSVVADYMNYVFQDIVQKPDRSVYGILSNAIIKLGEDGYDWVFHYPAYTLLDLAVTSTGDIYAGTKTGIAFLDEAHLKFDYYIPNAPLTNQFSAITVLNDGRVVAGSKYGLAIKESWGWRNIIETTGNDTIVHSSFEPNTFAADTLPIDFGGFVADIEQGPDGLVYCAIRGTYPEPIRHGGGIVMIDIDDPINYTIIDTSRLDYWYTSNNYNPYMVVKDLEFDRNGNLWVADTYCRMDQKPISVRTPEDEWGAYYSEGTISLTPNTLALDTWNRLWIGSFEGTENLGHTPLVPNGGLILLKYAGSPADPESYEYIQYDAGNSYLNVDLGLNADSGNNTVWSMGLDQSRLWALTRVGLIYFDLSSSFERPVLRQGPKSTTGTLLAYFPSISFGLGSKLKIDPRGNVWTISPADGIHVLLANGLYWPDLDPEIQVEGLTDENSFLLSTEVTDIEFDHVLGLAYITSKQGISAFKIPFADSKEDYSGMKIFPSPFHVPSVKPLIIDGLMDGSSLMVMTISGKVIRHIKDRVLGENGYQIHWDGKDTNGNWVGSGVYLLSVYDQSGESKFGKITVIRH